MTDAERLAKIERGVLGMSQRGSEVAFLLALARRALAAEDAIRTILTDRPADADALADRDTLVRDETARMVAAECVARVREIGRQMAEDSIAAEFVESCNDVADDLDARFGLAAGQQTLTQKVAAECAEIARATLRTWDINAPDPQHRIAAAIRERFGLPPREVEQPPHSIAVGHAIAVAATEIAPGQLISFDQHGLARPWSPNQPATTDE